MTAILNSKWPPLSKCVLPLNRPPTWCEYPRCVPNSNSWLFALDCSNNKQPAVQFQTHVGIHSEASHMVDNCGKMWRVCQLTNNCFNTLELMQRALEAINKLENVTWFFKQRGKLLSKTRSIYLPPGVDRKHLMRFQRGDALFKFLLRSVGGALENVKYFLRPYSLVIRSHILELPGEPKTSAG